MKIKWLGHAAFLITAESGTRIITDPYICNDKVRYGDIKEAADIVTTSHNHSDHNNVAAVKGSPKVLKDAGTAEVKGIEFTSIPSFHDESRGEKRGPNLIFCFDVDDIRVCHLGDLGHKLGAKETSQIGKVDVLLLPVGGFYTIDAAVATEVARQLAPRVVIPMHFKNDSCEYPIASVEEFLKGKDNVARLKTSEIELTRAKLPASTQIYLLQPAL